MAFKEESVIQDVDCSIIPMNTTPSIPGIRCTGNFRFREGQYEFLLKLAEAFSLGEKNHLGVFVPGYGKTITALSSFVVARSLRKAQKVVIFVPRGNLRDQYADAKELARVFMNIGAPPFSYCVADSEKVFLKNISTDIIITTYQYASGKGGHKALRTFCEQSPCMFIFDEVHHLGEDGLWDEKISQFPHSCSVALSGTPLRADNKTLFGVPFTSNGAEQFYVALHEVTLRSAHSEGRILKHVSGHIVDYNIKMFNTQSGETVEMSLGALAYISADKNNLDAYFTRKKLRFHDEYLRALLDPAFKRFAEKRQTLQKELQNTGVKRQHQMLVIAMSNKHAQAMMEFIVERYPHYKTARIGQDVPEQERLKLLQEYRDGLLDVMVQVDMIGEGTDIKPISVIIKADLVRAYSKTLQQIFRGMRFYDGFPETENVCDIYTANDSELIRILEWIANEEQLGLKLKQSRDAENIERKTPEFKEAVWELTDVEQSNFSSHELSLFPELMAPTISRTPDGTIMNVSEREHQLRMECADLAQKLTYILKSHGRKIEVPQIHAESKRKFGKAQEEMSLPELLKKKDWLERGIKARRII